MANIPISSFTAAANTTGIGMSGFSLTGSNAQSIIDLAATWNTSGTPTGIKLNVTDTASNAASLLMNLQVGGVSQFSVRKDSTLIVSSSVWDVFANAGATNVIRASANGIFAPSGGFSAGSTRSIGFSSGTAGAVADDTTLFRDAANTLAQRNGVNAQTSRIYNTYTDASNYERGFMRWTSNRLEIGAENAGTGSQREVSVIASPNVALNLTGGVVNLNATNTTMNLQRQNVAILTINTSSNLVLTPTTLTAFGGTTSSFPALKRDTVRLQARLADDSAFTNIQGKLTTETAYTAGAPTATGYIVLYDSNGTAYKVPAVAL